MTAAFASTLPWSYPGHSFGAGGYYGFTFARSIGLVHVGNSSPVGGSAEEVDLRRLIAAAPPRMCFAFAGIGEVADDGEEPEVFAAAVELANTGDRAAARKLLKHADRRTPMSAKLCRGFIDLTWSHGRAMSAFESVVAQAEGIVRPGFCGILAWSEPSNRPFLVALRALAWCRWRRNDRCGARHVLESLAWLDPEHHHDAHEWLSLLSDGVGPEDPAFPVLAFAPWWSPRRFDDERFDAWRWSEHDGW